MANEITISRAKALVSTCIRLDKPVWAWGPPGVGKSQIMEQLAHEAGADMTEIRLSLFDPVDLRGLPMPDVIRKVTEWLRPSIWPALDATRPQYLFFDEMDRAAPSVANAALQIVLGKQIGEHRLPASTRILAAGNGETDRTGTNKISSAQANRFTHLYVRPDAEAAAAHLASKSTNPAMVAFLRFRGVDTLNAQGVITRPGLIYGKAAQGEHAFPSARAWENVADFIDLPAAERLDLAKGTVGTHAAIEFEAFVESFAAIVGLMADIFANPATAPIPSEPSLQYAVAAAVANRADFGNWQAVNTYAKRMPTEFGICTILDAVAAKPALKNTPEYGAWAVANQSVALS